MLIAALLAPSPAYALRNVEIGQTTGGLEELGLAVGGASKSLRKFLWTATAGVGIVFFGACDRMPPPSPSGPPTPPPQPLVVPQPPPIPPAAVDYTITLLDRLRTASNKDAADRILRFVFGAAEPVSWRAAGPDARRAIAQRLLDARLTSKRLWELVAQAVKANGASNGGATLDGDRVHDFLNALNAKPYDGMYPIWKDRTDIIIPHELVLAILLKETERFQTKAKVPRDGHGLMQVNRTTLLESQEFWTLLQKHKLVTGAYDPQLSKPAVEQILFDPTTNVLIGILYLREQMARLVARVPDPKERVKFLLMIYNTGSGWTLGFYDPRTPGTPIGGALQTAAHYRVAQVFEDVVSKPVQWPPAGRRYRPIYLVPTQILLNRKLTWTRMTRSVYEGGVDYTRTGWATFQVLLQLTHPLAPPAARAGLEEREPGISRRGFLTTTAWAAAWLGLRGAPALGAPPAAAPQDGDRNRFTLGRHAFVVHPSGIARSDLVEFKRSYSEVYAPLPGVAALRMHDGVLYALMASSGAIRLFDNLTTGDAFQDYRQYGGAKGDTYLKALGVIRPPLGEPGSRRYRDVVFSGATAYVTSVASLDLPAGAQRTWRLEAYSVRNPAQPVLLWQRELAPPGTALDGPAVGALAMIGEESLAVALGDRQGVVLYRVDRSAAPVATLPLTDVATMIGRGSRLYVGQTGGNQDLARVMMWDLETPGTPRRVSETILQGTRALHDLAAGEAPQDPFLYVAVNHQLLIYETQGPQVILRGQWTFDGDAAQINVRDGIAYVVERFADETRQLHLLSVVSPSEPTLVHTENLWSSRVLLTSPDGQTIVYEDRRHGAISPYFLYQQRAGSGYGLLPFKDSLPELIPQFQDDRTVTFLAVGRDARAATAFFLFQRKPDSVFYEIVSLWDRAGHRWTVFDRDADNHPIAIIRYAFVPDLTAKNPRSVGITYSLLDPATGRARPEQTTVLLTFDPPRGGLEERGPGISRRGFLTTALGVALGLPIAAESLVTQPLHAQAPPTEAPLFEKPRRFLEEEAHALSPEQTERWLREAVARAPAGPIRAATETMATRLKTEGIRVYLVPGLDQWRQFNRTFRRTGEQNSAFTIHSDATGRVVIAGYAPLFGAGIILHEGIHALAFLKVWRPIIEAVAAGRTPSSEWQAQRNRLNEREGRAQAVYDGIWDRSGVEDPKRVFEQRRANIGKWAWDLLLELAGADLADLEQAPTHLRQRWIPWQGEFLANLYEMSVYPGWQHQANVAAPVRPRFVARADGGPLTADERAYFLEVVESQPPRGAPFVEAMRDLAERLREPAVSDREAPRLRQWLTRFYVEVLNLPDPWAAVRRGGLEERVMAQLAEAAQGPGVVARQRLENSQTAGPRATGQGGLSGRAAGGGGGTGQSTPPPRPMPESPATSEWLRMPDPSQSPLGNNHTLSQKSAASPTTAPPLTIPGIGWTNNPVASERGSNSLNTSIAARATNSRRFSVRNGLSTGASVSYPIGGINQPTLQALARPQGGPSILRPRSGSNPERQSKGSTRPSASPAPSAVEGLRTGLEELRITAGRVWVGSAEQAVGEVRAIYDAEGALVGRAVFPDRRRVRLVSAWNEAIERDEFPEWRQPPASPNRRLGQTGFSLDAWKARTARPPAALGGAQRVLLANSLQSNFYHPWGFLIADGRVVRQAYTWTQYPLDAGQLRERHDDDDALWAFVLEPGPPRIVAVRFKGRAVAEVLTAAVDGGRPVVSAPESKTSLGHVISGVPLILQGHDVSGAVRSKWQGSVPPQAGGLWPNEVNWDPKTTHAAFSAIGTMADGELCLLTVTKPLLIAAFARLGRRLRATNLLLLGGSADVQQEVEGEPPLIAPARADSPRAGERGRPLNAVLVGYELPAAGLEEPPWPADTGRARGVEEFSAYGVSGSALKILQDPHASFFERALALASPLGLDETDLGRMVDIDSETIRGWSRGRRNPSPRFVKAISDVLHASPIFLLTSQSEREAFRTRRVEERIALARTAAGFSQQELRQRIIQRRNGVPGVPGEGMGTSTLSDIELGYYTPQHRTCIDIGRVTGVAPALLETGFAPSPLGLFTPTHPRDRTQHGFKTGLSRWERQLVPQLAAALRAAWAQDPSSPTALTEPQSVQLAHSMIAALPGALDQAEHYGLLSPSVAQWLRELPRPSRDGGGRFRWDARYERRHQAWLLQGQQLGRVRALAQDLAENYRDLRPLFGNPWEFLTHLVNRARWLAFLNEFAFDRRRLIDAFTERMRSPEAFVAEKERRYQRACSRYLALSNHLIEDIVWMDDDADPRMEKAQTLSVFAQRRWVLSPSHFTDSAEGADSLVRNVAMGPYQALEDAVSAMERRDAAIRNVLATDSQPVSQLLTRVTPLAPVLAPLDQRRADEPGDPNVWAARDLLHRVIAWAQFENPAFLAGTTVEAGHLERPLTRIVQALGKAEAVGLPQGPAALDAFLRGIAHDLVTSGLEERLAQLAEAAQGPGVVEPQSLAGGQMVWPRAAGQEGLSGRDVPGVGSGTGPQSAGLPRTHTPAELSAESTTWAQSPLSGAIAHARRTHPPIAATNPTRNSGGSFPKKSPATPPANRILAKSAEILDNVDRRPSDSTDRPITSSLSSPDGRVNLAPLTLAPPQGGLEEDHRPTDAISARKILASRFHQTFFSRWRTEFLMGRQPPSMTQVPEGTFYEQEHGTGPLRPVGSPWAMVMDDGPAATRVLEVPMSHAVRIPAESATPTLLASRDHFPCIVCLITGRDAQEKRHIIQWHYQMPEMPHVEAHVERLRTEVPRLVEGLHDVRVLLSPWDTVTQYLDPTALRERWGPSVTAVTVIPRKELRVSQYSARDRTVTIRANVSTVVDPAQGVGLLFHPWDVYDWEGAGYPTPEHLELDDENFLTIRWDELTHGTQPARVYTHHLLPDDGGWPMMTTGLGRWASRLFGTNAGGLEESGTAAALAQLAEAAQGPGVVARQRLAGGQTVEPRALAQVGLSGRGVPAGGLSDPDNPAPGRSPAEFRRPDSQTKSFPSRVPLALVQPERRPQDARVQGHADDEHVPPHGRGPDKGTDDQSAERHRPGVRQEPDNRRPLTVGQSHLPLVYPADGAASSRRPLAPPPGGPSTGLRTGLEERRVTVPRLGRDLLVPEGLWGPDDHTTEAFLDMIVAHPDWFRGRRILEIGTGSGAIAIALARVGAAQVVAVDILPEAVQIARRNVQDEPSDVRQRILVGRSDLYAGLAAITGETSPMFDVVISNHPITDEEQNPTKPRSYAQGAGRKFAIIIGILGGLNTVLRRDGAAYLWGWASLKGDDLNLLEWFVQRHWTADHLQREARALGRRMQGVWLDDERVMRFRSGREVVAAMGIARLGPAAGLEGTEVALAQAAQGPGVAEGQRLEGSQTVEPRVAGPAGISGRGVPGAGFETGPQSAGPPRTHTPAGLSAESTFYEAPLSGAIAQARTTQPAMATTYHPFNSGESFPKKSPASLSSTDVRVNSGPQPLALLQGGPSTGLRAGLEERGLGWMETAIPTTALPAIVARVHAQAAATPKLAVLFADDLVPSEPSADRPLRWLQLSAQVTQALGIGHGGAIVQLGGLEEAERYAAQGYRVIRVLQDPERRPSVLPLSAVPLVAAHAVAAGGPTFSVVPAAYVGLEEVTLTESLATVTDLFA